MGDFDQNIILQANFMVMDDYKGFVLQDIITQIKVTIMVQICRNKLYICKMQVRYVVLTD